MIRGREVEVPGVVVRNFNDNPAVKLRVGRIDGNNDGKRRRKPVSLVVLHTTKGIPGGKDRRPQVILPGKGPDTDAGERVAKYWSTSDDPSGAHIVIDFDCTVDVLADLDLVCAYHAGQSEVNERSIGIEIYQGNKAELYAEQLETVVRVCDTLAIEFGIQRQFCSQYRNRPVERLEDGGDDVVGFVGHRHVSDRRGLGDPGDAVFDALGRHGYEAMNMYDGADRTTWRQRQEYIRAQGGRQLTIDGIPGAATCAALRELGYAHGLWTFKPAPGKIAFVETSLHSMWPGFIAAADGDKAAALVEVEKWLLAKRALLAGLP